MQVAEHKVSEGPKVARFVRFAGVSGVYLVLTGERERILF